MKPVITDEKEGGRNFLVVWISEERKGKKRFFFPSLRFFFGGSAEVYTQRKKVPTSEREGAKK